MAEAIISYPGAKWRFYKHMVEYFPLDMEVFIEPFLGGGSVSLSIADDPRFSKLERMIAGDLAPEMWAFWTGVKNNPSAVEEIATKWFKQCCPTHEIMRNNNISRISLVDYIGENAKNYMQDELLLDNQKQEISEKIKIYNQGIAEAEAFWKWTQTVNTSDMTIEERAARIILVNKISFSGMGDSGSLSKDQFCDFRFDKLNRVYETSKLLQRIEIYNVSFEETMKYAYDKPDKSFVFLDPPYWKQESSGLYGRGGDTHKGFPHEKFAEETKKLPCKWFITYDDSVFVRKMFQGKTYDGKDIEIIPFTIPGGYTMAGKTAEDALAGEEVFIHNLNGFNTEEDEEVDF